MRFELFNVSKRLQLWMVKSIVSLALIKADAIEGHREVSGGGELDSDEK